MAAALSSAGYLGLAVFVGALACGEPARAPSITEQDPPPRRPDGVWLEPPAALPPASLTAWTGESPVLALRTPVDRRQVLEVVHRLVDALVRNDEGSAEALCAPVPGLPVPPAVRVRLLVRSHDYTKLAGQRVFRDENVSYKRGNEDADGGVRDAGESERDVIAARIPIDVPQAGGEVLFGSVLGLDLVEVNGVLLIRDIDLNAAP